MWEMLQDFSWEAPDWVVVPGGNLGNTSAFGKALKEAYDAGWIKKLPRIATIQAEGANPFYQSFKEGFAERKTVKAETVATAIRIGDPVNFTKAVRVIEGVNGLVEQVTDEEILAAKKVIDSSGVGCEPASACSLAGVKKLVAAGKIGKDEKVLGILTGHMLKDTDAIYKSTEYNPIRVAPSLQSVQDYL